MEFVVVHPPKCLSNGHTFHVESEFWDDLSQIASDDEGKVAWFENLDDFHALMENVEGFIGIKVFSLLAHTLHKHPL